MSLHPESDRDGPVTVYMNDGDMLQYDRVFHERSGMVTLYNVDRTERENAGDTVRKGDSARTIPSGSIDHIEWDNYGPE
jgi:hypothetical protein